MKTKVNNMDKNIEPVVAIPDGFSPDIVAFCCNFCAYAAGDLAGSTRTEYPSNVRVIRMPCSGRIDIKMLVKAFEEGADGVYVAGCEEGACHFAEGNYWAKRRVKYAKTLLEEIGIDPQRLEMFNFSASMYDRFVAVAKEMTERVTKLGPSPIKTKAYARNDRSDNE